MNQNHHSSRSNSHNHHTTVAADGAAVSHSPRLFRRIQSSKRNPNNNTTQLNNNNNNNTKTNTTNNNNRKQHHEIDLHSPRSDHIIPINSPSGFDSMLLNKHTHPKFHLKRPLIIWMFFVFCGFCLFLGILKVCANGWFGSAIERAGFDQIRTVKVTNISGGASELDIQYVEMRRETETSQVANITFKETQGADAALGLAGSTTADLSVTATPVENYQLLPDAPPLNYSTAIKKAEDVISTVLAKGYVIGEEAVNKAKSLNERHHLTSNAFATISSINRKIGLNEKISVGTTVVNEKVREIDEKLQVSEKTKTVFAAAEQKASVMMSNPLFSTGASWLTSAYDVVARAVEDVGSMTKDKVDKVEGGKKTEVLIYQEAASLAVNHDSGDHDNSVIGKA